MLPSLEAATSEVPAPISHIAMLMSLNSFGTTAFIAAIGSRVSPAVSNDRLVDGGAEALHHIRGKECRNDLRNKLAAPVSLRL